MTSTHTGRLLAALSRLGYAYLYATAKRKPRKATFGEVLARVWNANSAEIVAELSAGGLSAPRKLEASQPLVLSITAMKLVALELANLRSPAVDRLIEVVDPLPRAAEELVPWADKVITAAGGDLSEFSRLEEIEASELHRRVTEAIDPPAARAPPINPRRATLVEEKISRSAWPWLVAAAAAAIGITGWYIYTRAMRRDH